MARYEVPGGHDAQFEPGSNQTVLRNNLGIISPARMEEVETEALTEAMKRSFREIDDSQVLSTELICSLHNLWLGEIYDFAGKYRTVNVSKGGIMFCRADLIDANMSELSKNILATRTPCYGIGKRELCDRLAEVHSELVLIHPFREGNGRLARWVSGIMAAQAGFPILNYSTVSLNTDGTRDRYFGALRKGFVGNYEELSQLFEAWIDES